MGNCVKKPNVRVTADYGDDDDVKEPIVRKKRRFRYINFDRDDHQANRMLKKSSMLHDPCYQSTIKGKPQCPSAKLLITTVGNGSNGTVELNGATGSLRPAFSNLRYFNLSELRDATDGFSSLCMIGEGGFGRVYKGNVKEVETSGLMERTLPVAIKKLNLNGLQGQKEWLTEVVYLSRLHQANLVKLIGCCHEDNQFLLIYEYMVNRSLDYHLFNRNGFSLPWYTRVKIALGVAKAMVFLHKQVPPIIYRDIKAANVLLDSNFSAKISDFGLAKDGPMDNCSHVTTRIFGSYGYADPQYMNTGRLRLTSDVYSFGVLLLELITGLPALDNTRPKLKRELVTWTKPFLAIEERRLELMDRRLSGQYCNNTASMVTALASWCLHEDPHRRPDMSTVATRLSRVADLLEMNSCSEGITLEASCSMPILGH